LIVYDEEKVSVPLQLRAKIVAYYALSLVISYLLLILIYQLDYGLFIAILTGYSVGYIYYGFKRRRAYLYIYNPKSDKSMLEIET
jgi:hypothetical protein